MIRNSVVLPACFAVILLGSIPCAAQTFGRLDGVRETDRCAGGLLNDPRIAKWLMTLPQSEDTIQTADADSIRTELFDPHPIGGEVHHLPVLPQYTRQDLMADALGSNEALDPHPIGGRTFALVNFSATRRAMAQNVAPSARPALEGRSVSTKKRSYRKAVRHGRRTIAHAGQICRCALLAAQAHRSAP